MRISSLLLPASTSGCRQRLSSTGVRRTCVWIPECLMATLADFLHASTDIQQRVGTFGLARPQRFPTEIAQGRGKRIESGTVAVDERDDLLGLELDTRSLRPGAGRGR